MQRLRHQMFPRAQHRRSDRSKFVERRLHLFELSCELKLDQTGQRLPDLALTLFLRLGGHVELPNKSFIRPLPGYVENKPGDPERVYARRNGLQLVRFDHIAGF